MGIRFVVPADQMVFILLLPLLPDEDILPPEIAFGVGMAPLLLIMLLLPLLPILPPDLLCRGGVVSMRGGRGMHCCVGADVMNAVGAAVRGGAPLEDLPMADLPIDDLPMDDFPLADLDGKSFLRLRMRIMPIFGPGA